MVNAPWQSDTTHSPGPAPSGFNLIWSEKNGRGGGGDDGGGGGEGMSGGGRDEGMEDWVLVEWRGGGGGGDKMKACRVILRQNRLTILHSSQIALSPPHIQH